ncbi:MAG: hypothetical protein ABIZ56_03365, partial [Chthoniobacteraceae bacterium]
DCRADYGHALLKIEGGRIHPGLSLGFIGIFERAAGVRSRVRAIAVHRRAHPVWNVLGLVLVVALTLAGATRAQDRSRGKTEAAITEKPATITAEQITKKLNAIVIPKLQFLDATVAEALDFLKKKSAELDTTEPDPARRGVPFFLPPSLPRDADLNARITVSLTNIPLMEAVKYVTALANLRFKVEARGVVVKPLRAEGLVDQEWNITPKQATALGLKAGADFKTALIASGVTFPSGANVLYSVNDGRLVMKNTSENIDLVDALVEAIPPETEPLQIRPQNETLDGRKKIMQKLDAIVIPKMEFRDATLREAVEFLKKKSVVLDTAGEKPESRGVNIVLKFAAGKNEAVAPTEPRLTVSLSNIRLGEALRLVTTRMNCRLKVEPYAVAILPPITDDQTLMTKEWKISAEMETALGFKEGSEAVKILEANRIEFPAGTTATFLRGTGRLIMRNTERNLDRVDILLDTITLGK